MAVESSSPNSPNESNNDSNSDDDKDALLEEAFAQVVTHIGTTTSGSDTSSSSASSDAKLRLYGLFKRVTVGPRVNHSTSPNGWFFSVSPVAMAKQRAWAQCQELTRRQAMLEYIQLSASLDATCDRWYQEYLQQQHIPQGEANNHEIGTETDAVITGTETNTNQNTKKQQSNQQRPPTKNSNWTPWIWNWIRASLPPPVIPRGGLDVTYSDLCFALLSCLKMTLCYAVCLLSRSNFYWKRQEQRLYHDIEEQVQHMVQDNDTNDPNDNNSNNNNTTANCHVVVGYSVRSLLDVYLMHKQYPPKQSEILIVPPINIPGIMDIFHHYGISVKPVETVKGIEQAIQPNRTKAVLVVHPFGNQWVSDQDMATVRQVADRYNLDLLEDAAEAYTGTSHTCGATSSRADITFWSFGLIKTATALGGGIAIVRKHCLNGDNAASTAAAMQRLQYSHPLQSTWEYFSTKVIKALFLHTLLQGPHLYGLVVHICVQWYGYHGFQEMATRFGRSIVPGRKLDNKVNSPLRHIRKRPSLPLLQLVNRRLMQSQRTSETVAQRIQQCQQMTLLLQQYAPSIVVPLQKSTTADKDNHNSHWLFPIQVPDSSIKDAVQESLFFDAGWDVAAGTSQLQYVPATTRTAAASVSRTREMMDRIMYLPVSSRRLSQGQMIDLARKIEQAVVSAMATAPEPPCNKSQRRRRIRGTLLPTVTLLSFPVAVVAVCVAGSPISRAGNVVYFIVGVLLPLLSWIAFHAFACMLVVSFALRWSAADLYMECSNSFAKYNSMFDSYGTVRGSDSKYSEQQARHSMNDNGKTAEPTAGILASMPSLELFVSPPSEEADIECRALVTGATGFIGSLLVRDLLMHRKTLNLTGGVILLCRSKRYKTAQSRIDALLDQDMFSFLSGLEKKELVQVLEGDVTKRNAGISDSDMEQLLQQPSGGRQTIITHVIHSAASVSFTQTLQDAAKANITPTLELQQLAARIGTSLSQCNASLPKTKFVHISTAFVHGSLTGTKENPLPQSLYTMGNYNPRQLYESMMGTEFLASKAMSDLRFHNTYAFSKCVCEHLLVRNEATSAPTIIIRPSIVGPSVESPFEGWAGQKPTTLVAAPLLYLIYQWNLWCLRSHFVPCVPVDVLSRFVLAKAFNSVQTNSDHVNDENEVAAKASISSDDFEKVVQLASWSTSTSSGSSNCSDTEYQQSAMPPTVAENIFTASWDVSSPESAYYSWLDTPSIVHVGSVFGYFRRPSAYVGIFVSKKVMPRIELTADTYERIHYLFVQVPMQLALVLFGMMGFEKLHRKLSKLSQFLDLPLLFFPYMSSQFYFRSELVAPASLDGDRYGFSCAVAAHRFLLIVNEKATISTSSTKMPAHKARLSSLIVGGSQHDVACDLWWALTQPKGNMMHRLVGWLFAKVLRATCSAVSVDLTSFEATSKARLKMMSQGGGSAVHIVLAPTHRSFFDFILLSYVLFAIPELKIDIPLIAAADEFGSLPGVGWVARCLGAFYLRRGRGIVDPDLCLDLRNMKQGRGACPKTLEVFLEGSRSRDRRFATPKTGFLRCLASSGGRHLIVPIAISYEYIPEQCVLSKDASEIVPRSSLNTAALLCWLKDAFFRKINLGRIHVAAADPITLESDSSTDFDALANCIQTRQQQRLYASEYHTGALSKLLKIDHQIVRQAMDLTGCKAWPSTNSMNQLNYSPLPLPNDPSELLTVSLQMSCQLAEFCRASNPTWCRWLDRNVSCYSEREVPEPWLCDSSSKALSESLLEMCVGAEASVRRAASVLADKGFDDPKLQHLLQTAAAEQTKAGIPKILLRAAAAFEESTASFPPDKPLSSSHAPVLLSSNGERLGFWGFQDSGFVMEVNKKGQYFVTMKGGRYGLAGKKFTKLLPFVEVETCMKIDPFQEAFAVPRKLPSDCCEINWDTLKELQSIVLKVSTTYHDCARHGTGHSQEDIYCIRSCNPRRMPDAVVWPGTEEEIVSLVSFARVNKLCLIPFGGGTNVTQATACPPKHVEPRPIVSVDMKHLDKIIWLNEEDGLAKIQAGITGRALVSELEKRGYTIGHEPDSIEFSTVGGWIATKASGMKRNKYGNIEDIVRDVEVAGYDGIFSQKRDPSGFGRESTGMELCSLMLGSEGCLGIITSAIVRVWPLPESKDYDSVLFANFEDGLRFVRGVSRLGRDLPASVRLLDNEHFRLGQALKTDDATFLEGVLRLVQKASMSLAKDCLDPNKVSCATICYEGSRIDVQAEKSAIQKLARENGGVRLGPHVGKAGYEMTFMIAYLRDFAMTYNFLGESFETFAPWSKVESIIRSTRQRIQREHRDRYLPGVPFIGCRVTQLYREGACLYFYFCMNVENVPNASGVFSDIEQAARSEIIQQGGSVSHHHGVGKVRAHFQRQTTTPEFQSLVSAVKKEMDPDNIFAGGNGLFAT